MKAIEKELRRIEKMEDRLRRQAEKKTDPLWKSKLEEKMFILKMLEVTMLTGEDWTVANASVDTYIEQEIHVIPEDEEVKQQMKKTARAFATDMLVTKFLDNTSLYSIIKEVSFNQRKEK